jgi:hypothetical protein
MHKPDILHHKQESGDLCPQLPQHKLLAGVSAKISNNNNFNFTISPDCNLIS